MHSLDREEFRFFAGLYPHQVEGIAFLTRKGRAILGDDMGLGKTRQAIVAMQNAAPDGAVLVM
jgi:SWI/SNF-related matrix-associated actin-dependent regulator 1 of chromatin subfamily A